MRMRLKTLTAAAVSALALVACSEDDDNPADSAANAKSVTGIVVEDSRFGTLETAVKAAGLAESLAGSGPFTVWAPTDQAFAALPACTWTPCCPSPTAPSRTSSSTTWCRAR